MQIYFFPNECPDGLCYHFEAFRWGILKVDNKHLISEEWPASMKKAARQLKNICWFMK